MATVKNTAVKATRKPAAVKAALPVPMLPVIEQAPVKVERPKAVVKNNVKAPMRPGKCMHVWQTCEAIYKATGKVPTLKELNAHEAMQGTNTTNNAIEFYRWRKFNGLNVK